MHCIISNYLNEGDIAITAIPVYEPLIGRDGFIYGIDIFTNYLRNKYFNPNF